VTAIDIRGLNVAYGDKVIIEDFSLTVPVGATVLVKGPSGCGKSTLLHAICGLIDDNVTGTVDIFGNGKKEIGIVFQNPETQLFCGTVEDEIAFGLENICMSPDEMGMRIGEILALMNLEKYRHTSTAMLSGGEKQRVVLGAVLALEPRILLLDEAWSMLDGASRHVLIQQLLALKESGITLVITSHDNDLDFMADSRVDM